MAERKPFLLRVDALTLLAVQRWANDDLRSLNAQIEFVLRQALARSGRRLRAASAARVGRRDPVRSDRDEDDTQDDEKGDDEDDADDGDADADDHGGARLC